MDYITIDISETPEIKAHYVGVGFGAALESSGGFCATAARPEYREHWFPDHIPMIPEGIGTLVVLWDSSFARQVGLTVEETLAILAHEEAHLVHEDVTLSMDPTQELENTEQVGASRIINVLDKEIRADRYAAERLGNRTMRRALLKIVGHYARDARSRGKEFSMVEVLRGTDMPRRLKELRQSGL